MNARPFVAWCCSVAVCTMMLGGQEVFGSILDVSQPVLSHHLALTDAGGGRAMVGQSFIPNLPVLTQIDINVNPNSVVPVGLNTVVKVDVFEAGGSPDGHAPTGSSLGFGLLNYDDLDFTDSNTMDSVVFDSPISVTPGSLYFIQITMDDPGSSGATVINIGQNIFDPYTDGRNIVFETSWVYHDGAQTRDIQFQTFGNVPEPSSLMLSALGAMMIVVRSRGKK